MTQPLSVLILGGCQTHMPLRRRARDDAAQVPRKFFKVPQIHTFGEMLQTVDVLRGRKNVPQELRPYCKMLPAFGPVPGSEDFADTDAVLVEPSSPIELTFRDFAIHRKGLLDYVLAPIREEHGREAAVIANRWFRAGLVGLNPAIRTQMAQKLLPYLAGDTAEAEIRRAIVLETEAVRSDIVDGFRKIREAVDRPMGVVIYVFRYMPDGRPISWNPGFLEEVMEAAGKLELPMFNPQPYVTSFGATAALIQDSAHYTDAFMPIISSALANFAVDVAAEAKHRESTPPGRHPRAATERDALASSA